MLARPLNGISIALAAALFAGGPALAQETQDGMDASGAEATAGTGTDTTQSAQSGAADTQDGTDGAQADEGSGQMLVATVGDTRITNQDVMQVIQSLPADLRERPAEVLVPFAVDQLVLRELILQEAMSEDLSEDPEVVTLVEEAGPGSEEDAMVSVWLDRRLQDAVTDEAVQDMYDQLAENAEADLPPLEDIRPQIEQQLKRQEIADVKTGLKDGVRVTFYGPDGEPMAARATKPGESASTGSAAGTGTEPAADTGAEADGSSESGMDTDSPDASDASDTDTSDDSDTTDTDTPDEFEADDTSDTDTSTEN